MLAGPQSPRTPAGEPHAGAAEGGEQRPRVEALLVELCCQLDLGQRRALEALAEARACGPRSPSRPRSPGRQSTDWTDEDPERLSLPAAGGRQRQDTASSTGGEDLSSSREQSGASVGFVPTPGGARAKAAAPPSPNSRGPSAERASTARSLWEGSNVSKEPARTPAGTTGAIDLIEHDPIGSYDLQGFWLGSALTATTSLSRKPAVWMKMPWFFRRFVSNFDWGTSAAQQRARTLVSSTSYEVCVMLLILANSAFLGWQVEHEAHTRRKLPMTTEVEAFFCMVFAVELAVKVYAMGCAFWTGGDASWNCFDVFVVLLMVLDFFGGVNQQVSALRTLRVLRVVRFLRSVRQLRFFSQLRIMIRSILFSLQPLLWASIVLLGMFYLFGLCFTQGVTDHLREHDLWEDSSSADLRRYFGTLPLCALSLFEAMSGGVNWGVLFDTLSPLELRFRFMFVFFVLFAIFGTANVVTGIFVEIANHWARSDSSSLEQLAAEKRIEVISRLRDLFRDLDTGGDGILTLDGMRDAISDVSRGLVNSFHALDLEVTDVRTLFLLLDRDRKGYINLNEFLLGCFRLTGEAKTLDVMRLQYQCEWMMHTMRANERRSRTDTMEPGGRPAPASEAEPGRTAGAAARHKCAAEQGRGPALSATWCDLQLGQLARGQCGVPSCLESVETGPRSNSQRSVPSSSESVETV